jgi:hypothetical protein
VEASVQMTTRAQIHDVIALVASGLPRHTVTAGTREIEGEEA